MQVLPRHAKRRWLIAGTFAVLAALALILHFLSDDAASNSAGQVRITAPAAPLPMLTPAASPTTRMAAIPVVPTHGNLRIAQAQAGRMIEEKRDRDWAPRSEAAILKFLGGIPYLGGHRFLGVDCATSTCEVTGIVDADPESGFMKPVWEAIERDTAGPELRAAGLERTAAIFDTGRSGEEFKIYYRRVVP